MKAPVLPKPIGPVLPLNIADPSRLFVWLILVRHHLNEIVRAAQDAIRPPSRRKLTRRAAAEAIALGARNVGRLLDAAKLAIPPGTPLPQEDPDADPPSDRGP